MKNSFVLLILFTSFFFFYKTAASQNVAINSNGASPDTSALLDLQSTNKGLLISRLSLTSLTDATTIPLPAHSLLIYNTNAALAGGEGYYYNSGTTGSPVWVKLNSSGSGWQLSGNSGTLPGTDFIGTTDAKDLVIKTNGSSRVNISSTGVTTIGDGTNDTRIEADGSILLEGTATAYTDLVVPLFNTRLGADNQAIWAKMNDNGSGSRGVYTYTFENQSTGNEEEVFFSVQLPHNWKEGSTIYPHVHWSPQTSGNNGSVVWGLEYTWVNYNSTTPLTFPNTTIITVTSASINGSSYRDKHLITSFNGLTPDNTQDKISSILMCRFFRKSGDAADTYNGNAAVLSVDFHYQMDGIGSHTEFAK
jgi:hypothetical protein